MTPLETYKTKAKDIFDNRIIVKGMSKPCMTGSLYDCGSWGSGMWRSAWAFDTLIDFFNIFPESVKTACDGNAWGSVLDLILV